MFNYNQCMNRRKRKGRLLKYPFFIFILAIIIFSILFIFKNIVIRKLGININEAGCIDEQSVEKIINIFGKSFFTSFEKEKENLEKRFICIKSINFKKNFPDKITVSIDIRKPAIIFYTSEASSVAQSIDMVINPATDSAKILPNFSNQFISDDEGIVYTTDDTGEIYKVNLLNRKLKVGDKIDSEQVKAMLQILASINSMGINAWENYLDAEDFYVKGDAKIIVFNLRSKLNTQIASLQLILQKAKIESEKIEFIDLRFDKPVVRYGKR